MTDTNTNKTVVPETFLTVSEHLDPDKHWVGESLGVPTQTEIAATVGSVSSPGDSPFVARADHIHKLGAGVVTDSNMSPATRYRLSRAAANIATGDQQHTGTLVTHENTGGWTGVGSIGAPLIAPSSGAYIFSVYYSCPAGWGGAGTLPSATIIDADVSYLLTFLTNTSHWVGGTLMIYCTASRDITFRIRNNTGATASNVLMRAEAVKLRGN